MRPLIRALSSVGYSISLTRRGSGVRVPQRLLKNRCDRTVVWPYQLVGSSQKMLLLLVEPLLSQGDIYMDISLLREFQLDWRLAGKAERTATDYTKAVTDLFAQHPEPTLCDVKTWIASTTSVVGRRKRGQAVRALGKWSSTNDYGDFTFWRQVP